MKLVPLGERVILKPIKQEARTKFGLYLPETARDDRKYGEVVAVGKNKDGKELPLKPGDRVIYGGYSNEEIEVDGEEYVIVEFKDVLAKVE